ncbi:MAG TPA: hypothetical protein VMW65_00005, partial [Chloroflexota bacterium]|nr:hypothetical protein [Chloroflexota bacterium]
VSALLDLDVGARVCQGDRLHRLHQFLLIIGRCRTGQDQSSRPGKVPDVAVQTADVTSTVTGSRAAS